MDGAGSRTQLPSLVLAAGVLLLLMFGTALLAGIPSPAIGAIVAIAIVPLLGFRELAVLWRRDRFEFAVGAVCFLLTLFMGAIAGILVAFVLSLVNLARRAASPAVDVLAANDDPAESLLDDAPAGTLTAPGILVIRLAAPLFFANADVFTQAVKNAIRAAPAGSVRHVVIDIEAVTDADVTAAESFQVLKNWLDTHSGALSFSRMRPAIGKRLRHLGIVTDERVYATNRAAVMALAKCA
jgi:SulP family sulfate permease